jgi:hypothetical protein
MNFALSPVLTPSAIRPTYVDGRWRKPQLSAMQIARARRLVLASGQPWTLTEDLPEKRRDKPVKFKGHKAERVAHLKSASPSQRSVTAAWPSHLSRPLTSALLPFHSVCRAAKVVQAMKEMPKRIEDYYKVDDARLSLHACPLLTPPPLPVRASPSIASHHRCYFCFSLF